MTTTPILAKHVSAVDMSNVTTCASANPETGKLLAYPLLDWLRFVLASVVVWTHEGIVLPGPINGGLAVEVFLALSGWLIGGILIRTTPAELPRFFYNRSTRIWPPYLATAVLLYTFAAVKDGIDAGWLKYLFYDMTFTHYTFTRFPQALSEMPLGGTGNHFWSISVEEQFYLFAPLIMLLLPFGRKIWLWASIAGVLLVVQSQFAAIALGVMAAIAHSRYPIATGTVRRHAVLAAISVLLLALAWHWNVPPIRAIFALTMVLTLTIPARRGRVGMLAGAISYPLYLNHWAAGFMIQFVMRYIPMSHPAEQALSYLNAILVAFVAWYLIDRQMLARRGRWYSPTLGQVCQSAAYGLLVIGLTGGFLLLLMDR